MSEISRQLYVEKIKGTCVRMEPVPNAGPLGPAGAGILAVIVETVESTPLAAFWGTAASCAGFEVIVRRRGN